MEEHEPCDLVKELREEVKELKNNVQSNKEITTLLKEFREEQKKGSKRFDNIETYIIDKEIKNGLKAKLLRQIELKQEDFEGRLKTTATKDELDDETKTLEEQFAELHKEMKQDRLDRSKDLKTYAGITLAGLFAIVAALIALIG